MVASSSEYHDGLPGCDISSRFENQKIKLISQQSKVMTYEDRDKYQKYLVDEFYLFLGNAKGPDEAKFGFKEFMKMYIANFEKGYPMKLSHFA